MRSLADVFWTCIRTGRVGATAICAPIPSTEPRVLRLGGHLCAHLRQHESLSSRGPRLPTDCAERSQSVLALVLSSDNVLGVLGGRTGEVGGHITPRTMETAMETDAGSSARRLENYLARPGGALGLWEGFAG